MSLTKKKSKKTLSWWRGATAALEFGTRVIRKCVSSFKVSKHCYSTSGATLLRISTGFAEDEGVAMLLAALASKHFLFRNIVDITCAYHAVQIRKHKLEIKITRVSFFSGHSLSTWLTDSPTRWIWMISQVTFFIQSHALRRCCYAIILRCTVFSLFFHWFEFNTHKGDLKINACVICEDVNRCIFTFLIVCVCVCVKKL